MEVANNGWRPKVVTALVIVLHLYIFISGVKLLGIGSNAMQHHPFAVRVLRSTQNPFVGLFAGIFITSIIQSSATASSIVVGLVAVNALELSNAIPIVMGANIGTTVTNVLVSMGYVMRREEFRRALGGAIVHDVFNLFVVIILLPLELAFGFLEKTALWLTAILPPISPDAALGEVAGFDPLGPVIRPMIWVVETLVGKPTEPGLSAVLTAVIGLCFIFFALLRQVKTLRRVMAGRAETFINKVLGKSGWLCILIGLLLTVMVQSSSITTSIMVPMAAAGIVSVSQIFPITIGANIGTTFTALIASLAVGGWGVTIALVHCLFNVSGMLLFYPIPAVRALPVRVAERAGVLAARSRRLAVVGVFLIFFGIPGGLIFLYRLLS